MALSKKAVLATIGAAALATTMGFAYAQTSPMRHDAGGMMRGEGHGRSMGPGMSGMDGQMMGMGPMMSGQICAMKEPMAARMAGRLETSLKLTDAQKPDFEALRAAMAKAEASLKAACPTEAERAEMSPPVRMTMAEKSMAAGLEALRTVREPFTNLYAKLTDQQRDSLRWMSRSRKGDHHQHG